jgi:uncharacterized SAM-binding protein YcdF (DUF218 family)
VLLFLLSKTFRRIIYAIFLAILLVVLSVAGNIWWTARQDVRTRSDAIVVLGASQFNGRPSEVFKARLNHAKALYDEGVAPRIVTVGGGAPGDNYTEAAAGASYLSGLGVKNVVAVGVGRNTLQSMKALAEEFRNRHWTSAVLVTDPWHSLRAKRMAQDQGVRAVTSPTRTGPANATRGTELRYIARETAGYLYYRLFHRSSERGPNAV